MKWQRKTMTAGVEETFDVNGQFATIINVGPGNLYVNFEKTADLNSLLIPAGMYRSFYFERYIKKVHLITDGDALVQIDDMR